MNELASYQSLPIEELRERVTDDLVRHYSQERVSLEDFERRTSLVTKAATRGEILTQVADLSPLPAEAGRPASAAAPAGSRGAGWKVASGGFRLSDVNIAIFSGSDYKGVWQAPRNLNSLCVFGGSNIDLRRAVVPPEGVTISCLCLFGGVDIVVPPGMRLQVRGLGVFGGFDRISNEVDDPYAPTVVVEGLALFGGVSVRVRA